MSVYSIYYREDGAKMMRPVLTREEYVTLRDGGYQQSNVAAVRMGNDSRKPQLAQMNYSCLPNDDGTLKGSQRMSSTVGMDVDHVKAEEMQAVRERIVQKRHELGLLMLELSARGAGYHLVFRRHEDLSQEQNLEWASQLLDVAFDKGAKDITRVFFTTTASAEDLLYLDDEIFKIEECKSVAKCTKGTEAFGTQRTDPQCSTGSAQMGQSPCAIQCAAEATDRARFIFRECMKEEGVTQGDLTEEGGRHTSVKVVLSHCNQLLTEDETLGVLKELMPEHWNDKNIRDLVRAYYTDYLNPHQRLSQVQKRIFRESKRYTVGSVLSSRVWPCEPLCNSEGYQSELSRVFASKTPPALPTVLPRLVKAVTCKTPDVYKATVAQAMFPPLAAYPRKLSFVYMDNQLRELRVNCLIVAGTGSGKDSCTKQPLKHIIADMKERDKVNRERLKKFNEEYNSKAGNKQKPQRPDDLVIQNIKSDITKAALVQRTDEANGAPLYVRLNELEQWDKIEGSTGRGNQFTTLKLCDDEENDFGADRASTQSVMGDGCLHLNWNANTTNSKVVRYFRYVMTDGPVSRLCLATVPEREIGSDIAVFGDYDEKYDEALKPFIDNLKNATGVINCLQAKKMIRRLKEECDEFSRLSQDDVFDNLTHRALVMAFRKACVIYVANGMKWENSIEAFCRWSLHYDLFLKMSIFGELIRNADADIPTSKPGPRNMMELLPDEFTLEDVKRVRQRQGMDVEKAKNMISSWKKRHYLVQMADGSYQKADKYKSKKV